ncbi:MAG: YdcF family protein [Alphaproteobacteria bacterium]
MNRFFACLTILCVAGVASLCAFAYVGYKDNLKRVDMAVLVGHGEYGSFLTNNQKNQLDQVLTRYHQGYFFDLYISAPDSISAYSKVPFAVAEYLYAGGIDENQLLIDDRSQSLTNLAENVHAHMRENNGSQVLVFANSLTMPRVKLAFSKAELNSSGFAHTSKLTMSDIPALVTEAVRFSRSFLGLESAPRDIQTAAVETDTTDGNWVTNDKVGSDLLFKPLELVSAADTQVAWQRVVITTQ